MNKRALGAGAAAIALALAFACGGSPSLGSGTNEHQEIIKFISGKLKEWEAADRSNGEKG
jgi:hypothetical protein